MPRFKRIVIPGLPHHITQRGNRRINVFLDDEDRVAKFAQYFGTSPKLLGPEDVRTSISASPKALKGILIMRLRPARRPRSLRGADRGPWGS